MPAAAAKLHLRRQLAAYLAELGYSNSRAKRPAKQEPELVRVNPVRGHIAFGETVLRKDLTQESCHERLVSFSQRRTRHRASIMFFIGVATEDRDALTGLLTDLGICDGVRGGHVRIVPIDPPQRAQGRKPADQETRSE